MDQYSQLALTYRRHLVLYPRRWRACHGEAIVGVMLEQATAEGRRSASLRDRLDLLRGGLAARMAGWDPEGRLAAASFGLGLGLGLLYLGASWDPMYRSVIGPFANPTFVPVIAWIAAYLCMLAGHTVAARRLILSAIVLHVAVGSVAAVVEPPWFGPSIELTAAFCALGLLAAARTARRVRIVTTAIVLPASGIAVISALTAVFLS